MMASNNNNADNLTQGAVKSVPVAADLVMIADQAAGGIPKQATLGSLPSLNGQITTENAGKIGFLSAGLPGMFGGTQSTTQLQSLASVLNSNVIFIPLYVSTAFTVSQIRFYVTTGVAASTVTVGFYNATVGGTFANMPTGAPIRVVSGATTTSATYVSFAPTPLPLVPNTLYWLGIQASTATTLSIVVGQLNIDHANYISQAGSTAFWTANILTYANVYSAGNLPTITQSSLALTANNYLPYIFLTV